MKASIVILNYRKSKRVTENVESILKQEHDFPIEIIIVDNSCSENSRQTLDALSKHKEVRIVINGTNIGYTRGNNTGAKLASGEFLFIVNPDIVWREKDTLKKLVVYMETHPKTGIAGPGQINEGDGKIAMTVRAWPRLLLQIARRTFLRHLPLISSAVAHDEMQHLDYTKTQPVDWLQSSFWITRKALWDQWGGLNEDYFIFMSDPDLCFRCWQSGHEVMYLPITTVYADGLRASDGGVIDYFQKWTLRQHLRDSLKYLWRYWRKGNPRGLSPHSES